jgi:lipid II:glycine glycyltransferase (peptidoglycan interpeptide bridge formation enzyme)
MSSVSTIAGHGGGGEGRSFPESFIKSLVPAELSVCDGAASFLQAAVWGRFKARFGWEARAFLLEYATCSGDTADSGAGGESSRSAVPLLVLTRPLAAGISFAYVPWGPESAAGAGQGSSPGLLRAFPAIDRNTAAYNSITTQLLACLARRLRPLLPRTIAFIRFDPPWYYAEGGAPLGAPSLLEKPFSRAAADIQPPDTVLIDLTKDEDALLADMKEKWRYNIRLAARKGVTVRCAPAGGNAEDLDVFYRLFEETARRDGIAIHSKDYYTELFRLSGEFSPVGESAEADGDSGAARRSPPETRLYIASHEGEDLAAVITLFRGGEATYLYGASSNRKRNLMAPHLLQWTAIRAARASGCVRYDLFGIPPNDDPQHPMAGLYRFKTSFGGTIIHRPGSWDFSYHSLITGLFKAAEGLRKALRSARKKR